ncbi:MAG: hypothetical protein IK077_02935, partial [Thermoguttaceae bacterium]|nr:hypothetical protein [Thermoguttaceae bacterium]
ENRNAEGRYRQRLEPATHDHADNPRARAASIAQRAPARVALASSLAKGNGERRADYGTPLERRLEETKRRATAYALHGAAPRPSFQIQGAY